MRAMVSQAVPVAYRAVTPQVELDIDDNQPQRARKDLGTVAKIAQQ